MDFFMLTVVYFSMLQNKLFLLLAKGNFTDIFSVGVAQEIKWLPKSLSAFTMRHQQLTLSATINRTLILRESPFRVTSAQNC
jgi:hypothetical protein